jgi:hypothetical protein
LDEGADARHLYVEYRLVTPADLLNVRELADPIHRGLGQLVDRKGDQLPDLVPIVWSRITRQVSDLRFLSIRLVTLYSLVPSLRRKDLHSPGVFFNANVVHIIYPSFSSLLFVRRVKL